MKTILGGFGDIQSMMQTVVDAVMHNNVEMAAAQEQALVATSATAKSRLDDINALASYTEASFERLNNAIVSTAQTSHNIPRLTVSRIS
jgi:hypothetical protein